MAHNALERQRVDITLARWIGSILVVALNIVLVVAILGVFGVETTTLAALMAAAGIAIGMAWSGLLCNFAAGAFLIVLRPFKAGDFVTAGGVTGTVLEIGLFATTIDHARQRADHRGQQQDLLGHHPELLGQSLPARGAGRRSWPTASIPTWPSGC